MVVTVHALGLDQAVTATPYAQLTSLTCTSGLATCIKRTSEVQACVLMGLSHPLAIVILVSALITHTLVPATSIRNTLVVLVHALELGQAVTAITVLAQVTCILEPAISAQKVRR